MTTYRSPQNDSERLTLLRRAYNTGRNEGSNAYLSQETLASVQALILSFVAAINAVNEAKAGQNTAVTQARNAADDLALQVQTARRMLRQNASHGKIPMSTFVHYGLPVEGRLPQPERRADWLVLAERLLAGDDQAQAAGSSALPDRAALAAAYDLFLAAEDAVAQAKGALLTARDLLQGQRQLVTDQISALVRELRYKLANYSLTHQREIMRVYGVRFSSDDKESEESEEVVAMSFS